MKRTLTLTTAMRSSDVHPISSTKRPRSSSPSRLYELGRLSSAAAAKMAYIPKPFFLMKLVDYGVDAFQLPGEDLQQDSARALRHL